MDVGTNFTPASLLLLHNGSSPTSRWENRPSEEVWRVEKQQLTFQVYQDFTTTVQVFILIGALVDGLDGVMGVHNPVTGSPVVLPWATLGNAAMLWCTCRTSVFKSVTGRFIQNLACSSICATLVCIPYDVALGASPLCCWWLHVAGICKAVKFLHKLFCSATVLSFAAIALDRYYSVLYPLERKISDARSRDLVIYIWVHAAVASIPVFAVANMTDVYATSSCSEARGHARSLGGVAYLLVYNITTLILPLAVVFLFMMLIRRALSASQKKKVIIAALRTPQNSISIPYVSQREAELHAALLAVVLAFSACSAPYGALVVYRAVLPESTVPPLPLYLTAVWLPKVSLLTNPLLFLTVNRSARRSLLDLLARVHRRYSRRNVVGSGGLASLSGEAGAGCPGALEATGRSGSQLLEMFNIGQQQIFRPSEEEEEEEEEEKVGEEQEEAEVMKEIPSLESGPRMGSLRRDANPKKEPHGAGDKEGPPPPLIATSAAPRVSPVHACAYASSSQVAPATPTEPIDSAQFGFGPFELPPQWLPETRNSKKRLLPPLGNTPEELIQTKQPRPRPERRISRNNKVSTIPAVDP